jgi:hypothetical protein
MSLGAKLTGRRGARLEPIKEQQHLTQRNKPQVQKEAMLKQSKATILRFDLDIQPK